MLPWSTWSCSIIRSCSPTCEWCCCRQGRGAGGAISINSDAAITSCSAGIVSITACTFTGNQANAGGAVQLVGAGHAQECHVSPANTSYGRYSASYMNSLPYSSYSFCGLPATPYCTIRDSSFDSNTASLGGGSIAVLQGYSVQMNNLTFTNSLSLLYGGAVAVSNGSALYSTNCVYTNCSAASGGAVYAVSSSESYLSSVVIPQFRTTFIYAADMYKYLRQLGSALTLAGNTFTGNTATVSGGAVHMSGANQLVSQGNTFINGRAAAQGEGSPLTRCRLKRYPSCVTHVCNIAMVTVVVTLMQPVSNSLQEPLAQLHGA